MELLALAGILFASFAGAALLTKSGEEQWTKKQNVLMVGQRWLVSLPPSAHTSPRGKLFPEYGEMLLFAIILLGTYFFIMSLGNNDADDDDDFGGGMMIPAYNPTN